MKMHPRTKPKLLDNQRKHSSTASPPSFPKNQTQIIHNHPYFPIGSEVEVTSDEEGFTGAWYLATVIQSPISFSSHSSQHQQQQGKIFVEYRNLLSDENGDTLLKEFVDAKFVRPKHPIDEHDKVCFEVNDVVDAFFQDGWWCGVVTHVISRNKYRVFFSNPPDEIEFQSSDLRIHKNWVDGKWVLPEKQRMRDWNSWLGTSVEVNIDPDNSCDVWIPATLIKQVANNTFLVEYKVSKEGGLQKVAIDSLHIRPPPPSSSNKTFNLLEKVDAFYDFRWLSGVVTKILADGRYIVYFKHTKKEKELSHAELRLHMEWHNGKWIQSLQDTSMTSNAEKYSNHVVNGGNKEKKTRAPSEYPDAVKNNVALDKIPTVVPKSCQEELQTPGNGKANYSSATPSNKRIKQTSANGNAIHSRSSRRSNEESASNLSFSTENCKSKMTQLQVSNNGTSVDADLLSPGHMQSNVKQSEGSNLYPTEMKDGEKHSFSKKRGRPPKLRALLSGDAQGENVDQTPNKSDVVKPFGPIVVGLTHDGKMIGSLGESPIQDLKLEHKKTMEDGTKYVDSSADHESGSEQQKEGKVTNLKRKRGRPPKVLFPPSSPTTQKAEFLEEEKEDDASDPKDDETHFPTIQVEKPIAIIEPSQISDASPTDDGIDLVSKITDNMKRLSDIDMSDRNTSRRQVRKRKKVPTKSIMMDINEPVKSVILKKGKKQKSTKQVVPQTVDDVDNSRIRTIEVFNNRVASDADRVVAGTSSNASDDDRPLSAWFEGAHSPAVDAKIPSGGTAGQSSESRQEIKTASVDKLKGKEQDKRQHTSADNVSQEQDNNVRPDKIAVQSESTAIVLADNQDLPFSKNSLVWEMIESMEVLKRVPQKPHFRPLYNCKEECREGLAIGSMVTFTSLVERISKFQFSDPKSLLDGYLEALVDLEELGFNVAPVREQLNNMISIKGRCEQAQYTSKEIESQIMELNLEKLDINEEISAIDKKIGELMEKRSSVMAKKERKEAEITLLQSSIDSVKDTLESAEREFEKATTSLW